jgi:hypothetical protein
MSEIPTDFDHLMTLVYILVFVTFGLAVLSMCADLAASELKWSKFIIKYYFILNSSFCIGFSSKFTILAVKSIGPKGGLPKSNNNKWR